MCVCALSSPFVSSIAGKWENWLRQHDTISCARNIFHYRHPPSKILNSIWTFTLQLNLNFPGRNTWRNCRRGNGVHAAQPRNFSIRMLVASFNKDRSEWLLTWCFSPAKKNLNCDKIIGKRVRSAQIFQWWIRNHWIFMHIKYRSEYTETNFVANVVFSMHELPLQFENHLEQLRMPWDGKSSV